MRSEPLKSDVTENKMCFKIREGSKADIQGLSVLFRELQRSHRATDVADFSDVDNIQIYRGILRQRIERDGFRALLAERDGKPIAYVLFEIYERAMNVLLNRVRICVIHHVFVIEEFRRQGLMTALVKAVEGEAKAQKAQFVDVSVRDFSLASQKAFRSMGYQGHRVTLRNVLSQ